MQQDIVLYPAPSLQLPSEIVRNFSELKTLVPDMIDAMIAAKGIGIAAPQIGKNIRCAIIHKDADKSLAEHLVIVNPKIFSASRETEIKNEGCLSIPGVDVPIARHKKIKVRFTDIYGNEHKVKAVNFFARVLQHEIDHLDGILITDRTKEIA